MSELYFNVWVILHPIVYQENPNLFCGITTSWWVSIISPGFINGCLRVRFVCDSVRLVCETLVILSFIFWPLIVLSVLFRFTDSYYPFGNCKLVLCLSYCCIYRPPFPWILRSRISLVTTNKFKDQIPLYICAIFSDCLWGTVTFHNVWWEWWPFVSVVISHLLRSNNAAYKCSAYRLNIIFWPRSPYGELVISEFLE